MVFLGGGIIWWSFGFQVYIYICIYYVQYVYTKKIDICHVCICFLNVSLWMQQQEWGMFFFHVDVPETKQELHWITSLFFSSYIGSHTGWSIEIPTMIYNNTCNEGQSHPFNISKDPGFWSLLTWYDRRDVTRMWRTVNSAATLLMEEILRQFTLLLTRWKSQVPSSTCCCTTGPPDSCKWIHPPLHPLTRRLSRLYWGCIMFTTIRAPCPQLGMMFCIHRCWQISLNEPRKKTLLSIILVV